MKKITTMIILLIIVLVGCGKGDPDSNSQSGDKKVLVVGTTNASPPSAYVNGETDEIEGIMIDLAKETAKKAGYEVKFETMNFASLIPALDNERIDFIAAGMAYNEERAEIVSFTDIVYGFHEALVVPSDNQNKIKSLVDLEGKRVGVSSGTIYVDMLNNSGVDMEIKQYDSSSQIILDLTQGRLDAMISDTPIMNYIIQTNPKYKIEIVDEYKPTFFMKMGFVTKHEDTELRKKLDEAILEMKDDGTLDEIHQKWDIKRQDYY